MVRLDVDFGDAGKITKKAAKNAVLGGIAGGILGLGLPVTLMGAATFVIYGLQKNYGQSKPMTIVIKS